MSGLAAHHPPSHYAFGVLHRNSALAALHQHDERNHRDHYHQNHNQVNRSPILELEHVLVNIVHRVRYPHHDPGEDDQRHSITDAPLGDLLAQPHDERGTGGQAEHGHQQEPDAGVQYESPPRPHQPLSRYGKLITSAEY